MDKEKTKWWHKWHEHKHSTKGRTDKNGNEIEFRLTFDEWLGIWLESGHINERGRRKGQYVMSRINDLGHYEVGNVEIKTCTENLSEGNSGRKHTDEAKAKIGAAKKGSTHTDEARAKIGAAKKGKKFTDEHIAKMSAAHKAKPKLTCPHCGITCAAINFARWHGDNCKHQYQTTYTDTSPAPLEEPPSTV